MRAGLWTVLLVCGCASDPKLGDELQAFCNLVTEAEARHPDDRAARSRYVAQRSDAALTSSTLVGVLRELAIRDADERPALIRAAAERGGLSDFECPAMLNLYQ
ncbi:MAG: hypothetical protein AAFQ65_12285 [Myxococcota bacterium]